MRMKENKMPIGKETGRREKFTLADNLSGIIWASIKYQQEGLGIQTAVFLWGIVEIAVVVVCVFVMLKTEMPGIPGFFGVMACVHFVVVIISCMLFVAFDPYSGRECKRGIVLSILFFLSPVAFAIMLVVLEGAPLLIWVLASAYIAGKAFEFFMKMRPLCELGEQFEEVSKLITSPDETERLKAFDDLYALLPADKIAEKRFLKAMEKSGDEVLVKRAKDMEEKRWESLHEHPKFADLDL
jgi:hypothetical protein